MNQKVQDLDSNSFIYDNSKIFNLKVYITTFSFKFLIIFMVPMLYFI